MRQNKELERLPDSTQLESALVGPVRAVSDEIVVPADPTTATRMDGFTE
jgi:tartrate dehydratase beta subunit/fumarate hydratase class I family protein